MKRQSKLAVIVPAWNAEDTLGPCLTAIFNSDRRPDEVYVYNDGSSDMTGTLARRLGATVLDNFGPSVGPGVGRHRCAAETDADILVFVDADVEVHPEAIGLLEAEIQASEDIGAAFGSYDDEPHCHHLAAKYTNLRHHYMHHHSKREATTFWTGLGAIRSQVYKAEGGFDGQFTKPSIEDVELGARLIKKGWKIRLQPAAQGKHWKDWTLTQLWETDILRRAVPWSRLIISGQTEGMDLNLTLKEKAVSLLAHSVWLTGILSLFVHTFWPVFATTVAGYLVLNAGILMLFLRKGGLQLFLAGAFLQWSYHVYASVTFGVVLARHMLRQVTPRFVRRAFRRPANSK